MSPSQVDRFVAGRALPAEVGDEIQRHFESVSAQSSGQGGGGSDSIFALLSHSLQVRIRRVEVRILPLKNPLPPGLQVEVARNVSRALLGRVAAFRGCGDAFLDRLAVQLREEAAPPETYLYRVNEMARELFIVAAGYVDICVADPEAEGGDLVTESCGPGAAVGSLAFFFGIRHTTSARSPGRPAQLFVLSREAYLDLAKLAPADEEAVVQNVLSMFDRRDGGGGGGGSQSAAGDKSVYSSATSASMKSAASSVDAGALDGIDTIRRVLDLAKKKKLNERVVSVVAAAAEGNLEAVQARPVRLSAVH